MDCKKYSGIPSRVGNFGIRREFLTHPGSSFPEKRLLSDEKTPPLWKTAYGPSTPGTLHHSLIFHTASLLSR